MQLNLGIAHRRDNTSPDKFLEISKLFNSAKNLQEIAENLPAHLHQLQNYFDNSSHYESSDISNDDDGADKKKKIICEYVQITPDIVRELLLTGL